MFTAVCSVSDQLIYACGLVVKSDARLLHWMSRVQSPGSEIFSRPSLRSLLYSYRVVTHSNFRSNVEDPSKIHRRSSRNYSTVYKILYVINLVSGKNMSYEGCTKEDEEIEL